MPSIEGATISSSRLALPFKRSWRYLTDSAAMLPPTLDALRVYLPLAGGRVIPGPRYRLSSLVNRSGGVISAQPSPSEKRPVYIVTRKTTEAGLMQELTCAP